MMNLSANPLLHRYRCSLLRPGQFWVLGLTYGLTAGLVLLVNGSLYTCSPDSYANVHELGAALYVQFLILLAILLLIIGPVNTGNALQIEQAERSYDFFRLLPLSPADRALGILFGRNLAMLPFAGISAVLMTASGCVGGIGGWLQVQILIALGGATIAANLAALLLSQRQRLPRGQVKPNHVSSPTLAVVLASVVAICVAGAFAANQDIHRARIPFYGLELPWLVVVAGIFLFVAAWSVAGVVRSFRVEDGPLFTRPAAIAFLLGGLAVCAGLFWTSFHEACPQDAGGILTGYGVVSSFPLLIVLANASRSRQDYLDDMAIDLEPMTLARAWGRSNVGFWFGCFVIWAGALVAFGVTGQQARFGIPLLLVCAITGASFLFWAGLIEMCILCAERNPKLVGLFVVFFTIQSVLPLLLAAVFGSTTLLVFSPFGAPSLLLMPNSASSVSPATALMASLLHLLLGLAVLVPLNREYRDLVRGQRVFRETGRPGPASP